MVILLAKVTVGIEAEQWPRRKDRFSALALWTAAGIAALGGEAVRAGEVGESVVGLGLGIADGREVGLTRQSGDAAFAFHRSPKCAS